MEILLWFLIGVVGTIGIFVIATMFHFDILGWIFGPNDNKTTEES